VFWSIKLKNRREVLEWSQPKYIAASTAALSQPQQQNLNDTVTSEFCQTRCNQIAAQSIHVGRRLVFACLHSNDFATNRRSMDSASATTTVSSGATIIDSSRVQVTIIPDSFTQLALR
jgi:hypothetical protein